MQAFLPHEFLRGAGVRRCFAVLGLSLGWAVLAGCATTAHHPALQLETAVAPLIPVRDFVASRADNGGYKISPDGRKLAWFAVRGVSTHFFIQNLDSGETHTIFLNNFSGPYSWAQDSRHLVFAFNRGDENWVVARLDTQEKDGKFKVTLLTPPTGVNAGVVALPADDPQRLLVQHNERDKSLFDLYAIDMDTGQQTLLAQNPGNVSHWVTDRHGRLVGQTIHRQDRWELQWQQAAAPAYKWDFTDTVQWLGLNEQGDRAYLLSNRGRDRIALVELEIGTGLESVLHADPQVDVSAVFSHPVTGRPLRVHADPDYPQATRLDDALPVDFGLPAGNGDIRIISSDRALRRLVLMRSTDKGSAHYLYHVAGRQIQPLGASPSLAFESALADVRPVVIESRDKIPLHGYLTLPQRAGARPLPMVLLVHGGPWQRDTWHFNTEVQFLANRGYAVLQVNFRGSVGYGRHFEELAVGEFGGRMQDDLLDAVDWAVAQGIADPDRIAISGGSYGGYAALMGLAATPQRFACAIDTAGPTDLARLVEDFPKYWKFEMDRWYRYAGDPADAALRQALQAKSPLFQTERMVRPLLVVQGGQDVRVRPQQSTELVDQLRQQGKPVELLMFPREGHGVGHWVPRLALFRKMEDFLASCLGGRSGGFDYYQLGSWLY